MLLRSGRSCRRGATNSLQSVRDQSYLVVCRCAQYRFDGKGKRRGTVISIEPRSVRVSPTLPHRVRRFLRETIMQARFHLSSAWGACFVVAVGCVLLNAVPAAETVERSALVRLLDAAELKGRFAPAQAEQRFEAARAASSDDRLVHYAYGIVLSRLLKFPEAQAQFALASDAPNGPYPPAYRAALFLELQLRRWQSASKTALTFGGEITNSPDAWTNDEDRAVDARWLGQATSAGQLLATNALDVRAWIDVDRQLRRELPTELLDEYSAGFEETLQLRSQFVEQTEESRAIAQQKLAEAQEVERRKLAEKQRETESSRVSLQEIAKGNQEAFQKQLGEFSKQLGLLENQWNQLDERRQHVERSIILLGQELTVLQQAYQNALNQDRDPENPSARTRLRLQGIDQQIARCHLQSLEYQAERDRTITSLRNVQGQANTLLSQRQAAIADYEKQTGEIMKRDEQLEKWSKRIVKKAVELNETPQGNTAEVKTRERKLQSIGAYLALDWEGERQRLRKQVSEE